MNKIAALLLAALASLPPGRALAQQQAIPDRACQVGAYRLADNRIVDIAPSDEQLRWRMPDGTSGKLKQGAGGDWTSTLGWTGKPDGKHASFGPCDSGAIRFDGTAGKRIDFAVTETRFQGAGVTLAGRLVLPPGNQRVPIVVLIHGSEQDSARDSYALQRLFPAAGIGAFVYDKRGTGESGGRYTQDYLMLADDAIAALHEARRLAGSRAGRMGYQGGSQGGWVAPLAAKIEPVDFVIVSFGLAVSPLEEDRSALALDITRHGYGSEAMAGAMQVADATSSVLLSDFREGYDQVEAVKARYGKEPWFRYLHGDVSFYILGRPVAEVKENGPLLLRDAPMQYDPMPVLRNLRVPQLWVLGEDDIDAPSAETALRLQGLAAAGLPVTATMYAGAEHGMYRYEVAADGERLSTRQPEGYFRMMCDFVREGALHGDYGAKMLAGGGS